MVKALKIAGLLTLMWGVLDFVAFCLFHNTPTDLLAIFCAAFAAAMAANRTSKKLPELPERHQSAVAP